MTTLQKEQVKPFIGKKVYVVKKDGTQLTGKLVECKNNTLKLAPISHKKVQTKAILPLVLFDLLAIGTAPYAYGGYPVAPYGGVPFAPVPYYGYW
jgi:hypothetical protein